MFADCVSVRWSKGFPGSVQVGYGSGRPEGSLAAYHSNTSARCRSASANGPISKVTISPGMGRPLGHPPSSQAMGPVPTSGSGVLPSIITVRTLVHSRGPDGPAIDPEPRQQTTILKPGARAKMTHKVGLHPPVEQ